MRLVEALGDTPVVLLTGPRRAGIILYDGDTIVPFDPSWLLRRCRVCGIETVVPLDPP